MLIRFAAKAVILGWMLSAAIVLALFVAIVQAFGIGEWLLIQPS